MSSVSIANAEVEDNSFQMDVSSKPEKSRRSGVNWRNVAIFSGILALLLAVGLATTLGIFLTDDPRTECYPPPPHDLATTTYSGSAEPGSVVTYVCPRPLVFPNNNQSFLLRCKEDLEWEMAEVPPCSRQAAKKCESVVQEDEFDLSLDIEDTITNLQVKLTLVGQLPKSLLLDIPSDDEDKCTVGGAEEGEGSLLKQHQEDNWVHPVQGGYRAHLKESQPVHTITIIDSVVDAASPYEIRIRGVGEVMAVSLVQEDYLNITLHRLPISSPSSPEPMKIALMY